MTKHDTIYLRHIWDAIDKIGKYVKDLDKHGFDRDSLVQDGVIRQLEIIGEATKNLSDQFKEKYPHIPWKDMAGMRDKLIHQYFGVDMDQVWETVIEDLPALREEIAKFISV